MSNWIEALPEPVRTTIPPEVRDAPALKTVPDIATLAKSYLHAQQLIGVNRAPAFDPNWNDDQLRDHYSRSGRPATALDYKLPEDVKFEEGVQLDEQKFANLQKVFYDAGLTKRQANAMIKTYADSLNSAAKAQRDAEAAEVARSTQELQKEYGDKYEENVNLAKAVLRKVGSDDLINFLNESRLGNNPHFIRAMIKIGSMITEDSARGGGLGNFMGSADAAKQEIKKLQHDVEFQKALQDAAHPNHKDTVARWLGLFQVASPGKQANQ